LAIKYIPQRIDNQPKSLKATVEGNLDAADHRISELRLLVTYLAEINVIKKQIETLEYELRITTQRVNLFEKVKIPECLNNVRVIRIYLGDQQANAVGISKVAKKKIVEKDLEEVLV